MFVRVPLISSVYWICLGFKRLFTGIKHTCEIDLTEKCNLNCSHCYFFADGKDKTKEDFSLEIWAERFAELYRKGIRKILFVGGEPALRLDVLELADSIFPVLHVITNGIIKIPVSFNHILFLSIDGNEETNDRIRGAGTYRKLIDNYKNDSRVIVNMTLSGENYKELESVVRLSIKNRFSGVACNIYSCDKEYDNQYEEFIPSGVHKKIVEEIERVKKIYPAQLLFTKSMVAWYKNLNHISKCYWRENVDHYDVDFNRRTCFVNSPDCAICGCYAGAFSSVADKPFGIMIYSIKCLTNRITRLLKKQY